MFEMVGLIRLAHQLAACYSTEASEEVLCALE